MPSVTLQECSATNLHFKGISIFRHYSNYKRQWLKIELNIIVLEPMLSVLKALRYSRAAFVKHSNSISLFSRTR